MQNLVSSYCHDVLYVYMDMYMWWFEHSERWNFKLNFGSVNSLTLVQSRCKTFRTQWCTPWRVCWRTIWREWRATWRSRSTKLGRTTKLNCKRLHVHDKLIAVECSWMENTIFFSAKLEKEKKQQAREVGMTKTEVTGAEVCPRTHQQFDFCSPCWRHDDVSDVDELITVLQVAEETERERRMLQLQMCEVQNYWSLSISFRFIVTKY